MSNHQLLAEEIWTCASELGKAIKTAERGGLTVKQGGPRFSGEPLYILTVEKQLYPKMADEPDGAVS